ncbi:YciI family protein [Photobacterium sp. 1_MG-2023]|uniref:YciI family protein n=1 Tax=Photobacterium sp. 1_MG-2023 TaxID=3062646 RepID=UPI0026E3D19B|nr:YciI family protein [Photobacterium sp. 1_MG-2023]MDO6705524.1 YciI family protein [Photobacterium sp. 1_MG-2023]
MKYVALVYYDEATMKTLSQAEWDALNRECMDCGESLRSRDYLIGGEALLSVQSATTLRVRNGQVDITDGPFAETKEQLAGFYLLDVRDLNEAIQVASKIPPARYGCVEIRPVRELQAENNVSYQDLDRR